MKILACITMLHDLWLVALAAAICVFGSWISVRLFLRSRARGAGAPAAWVFLGAVAAGSTVWCTHFVAMLAYRPGVPVSYEPGMTGLSLAVAILAAAASLAVGRLRLTQAPAFGGGLFGAGVAAMHYTGMAAFGAEGVMLWDAGYVVLSVVLSVIGAAIAFQVSARPDQAEA